MLKIGYDLHQFHFRLRRTQKSSKILSQPRPLSLSLSVLPKLEHRLIIHPPRYRRCHCSCTRHKPCPPCLASSTGPNSSTRSQCSPVSTEHKKSATRPLSIHPLSLSALPIPSLLLLPKASTTLAYITLPSSSIASLPRPASTRTHPSSWTRPHRTYSEAMEPWVPMSAW